MKYKLILFTSIIGMLWGQLYAMAAYPTADVNFQKESLIVSGSLESAEAGKTVKFMVLNPEKTLADVQGTSYSEAIQNFTEVISTENGAYSAQIPLLIDAESRGIYNIYVYSAEYEAPIKVSKYYAGSSVRKNTVKSINEASRNTMAGVLNDAADILDLRCEPFEKGDIQNIAALLYDIKEKSKLSEEDVDGARFVINKASLVNAYNEKLYDVCYDDDGDFKFKDIIDLKTIDKDGVSLYSIYTDIVNDTGKKLIRDGLMQVKYTDENSLKDCFARLVFVNAIKNAKTMGNGHVSQILTKANADRVGVSVSNYLNIKSDAKKGTVASKLMLADFSTPETLVFELNKIISSLPDDGNGGGNGGGNGNGGGGGGAVQSGSMVDIKGKAVQETEIFNDIANVAWAKEAIEYLYNNHIINGTGEGRFSPENTVTREQFVVMLINTQGNDLDSESSDFEDVEPGSYYEKHVAAAKRLGIVNGITENSFGVGMGITRGDLCVMLYRAWFSGQKAEGGIVFSDSESIAEYAKEPINFLSGAGIINGFEDNTFRAELNCTRAQAAKIIFGAIKYMQGEK